MKSFASFLLAAIFFLNLTSCKQENGTNPESTQEQAKAVVVSYKTAGLSIGDKAPDFKLKNVDGKFYSLRDIKDANGNTPKGYIVTFTCNTCPIAQAYEDRLIALHQELAPKGYPLVAIQPNDPGRSPGDSMEAMKTRARHKNYPFVYLLDADQTIYPQYGASRTPEIFLLDNDLILHYHGAVDDDAQSPENVSVNYVKSAIEALEKGEKPQPAEVKAIGCTIKARRS